ncbi:MAG: 4a-hydroxytetrahydrobiopterin dehydratase [Deltaproteobacteria bacterium]|nr:4a-hydroxytetrahydrobiopterin dehydratase [Deltaproteobacteria bacterium]
MERPAKLVTSTVEQFLSSHDGWKVAGEALEKTYAFPSYGPTVAFAVHIGFAAEKRDHHPDLHISWGKVLVRWTTHDAGGITSLDVELAELCDNAYHR